MAIQSCPDRFEGTEYTSSLSSQNLHALALNREPLLHQTLNILCTKIVSIYEDESFIFCWISLKLAQRVSKKLSSFASKNISFG